MCAHKSTNFATLPTTKVTGMRWWILQSLQTTILIGGAYSCLKFKKTVIWVKQEFSSLC